MGATVYREALTNDEFDESASNHQAKTTQKKVIALISAPILYFNTLQIYIQTAQVRYESLG